MENNISVLKEFEYINLPNFYTNRYEVMVTHSFTEEEDDFIKFSKDEFENNTLLQLVLLYINSSDRNINKNEKLPWLYEYLARYDFLPSYGKVYPHFTIDNLRIYYYELGSKFYVKIPNNFGSFTEEELIEYMNHLYKSLYGINKK